MSEELDAMRQDLNDARNNWEAAVELNRELENELALLREALSESTQQHIASIDAMNFATETIKELRAENDELRRRHEIAIKYVLRGKIDISHGRGIVQAGVNFALIGGALDGMPEGTCKI